MMERNKRTGAYSFSFWYDDFKGLGYDDELRKYCKWVNPDYTFPEKAYPIIDAFKEVFNSCRVVIYDNVEGFPVHMHRSNGTQNWTYTIGLPYTDTDTGYELRYCEYQYMNRFMPYDNMIEIYKNNYKSSICTTGTRLFFPSTQMPHGVMPTPDTKWLFIFVDLKCEGTPPFTDIGFNQLDIDDIPNIKKDMRECLANYPVIKIPLFSELYFNDICVANSQYDYIPNI
jgi:hypothetical protein